MNHDRQLARLPARPVACLVGLVAVAVAGCTTADSPGDRRGPQFEEAPLLQGCPDGNVLVGSAVTLEVVDEDGAPIGAPLSVPELVSVTPAGLASPGASPGSFTVSADTPRSVTVVVTLERDPGQGASATTLVDRCIVRFAEAEPPPPCESDDDCDEGLSCVLETGACVEPPPPPCEGDGDCDPLERCDLPFGECVERDCLDDEDCDDGEACTESGVCEAVPQVRCGLSECSGEVLGLRAEISGRIECRVTSGTAPAALDVEVECLGEAESAFVTAECDLFGGPVCEAAFGAAVDSGGAWQCGVVALDALPGPVSLVGSGICSLSFE
ncbi:MAG: hypothetical protein KDF63_11235 [Rhodoferax sp.]|nr:hypothetical protein [Rhodoferax sp.]